MLLRNWGLGQSLFAICPEFDNQEETMAGKRRKLIYSLFWGILFLALIGGVLWCYRSSLTAGTVKFALAQPGTINHERKVTATFANQELPVYAPVSGKLQFLGRDGERYRRGEPLATIEPEGATPGTSGLGSKQSVLSPSGGLFFSQSDGLETIVTGENMLNTDLNKLLAQIAAEKNPGTTVQKGEAVGKIVNNLIPTVAFVELSSLDGLVVGKRFSLKIGDKTLSTKILRKSEQPRGVVVQFPYYIDGSALHRRQEIVWICEPPTNGVLIPKSALWTRGEELGIYLWSDGVVHFQSVKVLDENDTQACIENLTSGVPVVITPRDGLDGLAANAKNILN